MYQVTDLRILGMAAQPPEVVVDFDPANPSATQFPDVPA